MKHIFIIMLIFSALAAHAQEKLQKPDFSKSIYHTSPSTIGVIHFGGSSNTQSVDLKWKPLLTKKYDEVEHEEPNQELIDSIKEMKLRLQKNMNNGKSAERTTITTPVVTTTFAGNTNNLMTPMDNNIAVSYGGIIVSVSNHSIYMYNSSGTNLYMNSIESFLPSSFGVSAVCDPVVLYDASSDRFIFFCQEYTTSFSLFPNNRIFICFSKSNNPSVDGFWCYHLTGDPTGAGDAFDYPKMAVNDSELFITGNLFVAPYTCGTCFHQSVLFQIDKLAGYAGTSFTYTSFTGIGGAPFTLLPVSYGQYGGYDPGVFLVSTNNAGGSTINLYYDTANLCCNPAIEGWVVPTTTYSVSANAQQSGTSCVLSTGACRALSGFWLNNTLHFVFNSDAGGGYTGINYNRLSTTALTNVSSIFGASGYHYTYPSVASFATTTTDKSVMIGFGRSGASIYPEIRAVNCDDAMSWSGSVLVQSSPTYIGTASGTTRWGDYTGTSRNHSSASPSIWMNGMFGDATHNWNTWIAEIGGGTITTCAMPTGLSATSITSTSATLNWSAAAGAINYNVNYRQVGTTTWSSTSSATPSVAITGLTPSTTYEFQVQTVCSAGVSSWSVLFDFTTLPTPSCGTPVGLSVSSITSASATLNWATVTGAISYNVRYRIGTGSWTTLTGIVTTSTSLTGLTSSTLYEFQVQAVCSSLTGIWSSLGSFTTLTALGIASNQNPSATKVFPNPITNTFSVEFSLNENVNLDIAVIDVNGKVVKDLYNGIGTTGDNVFSFDKSNLASGVYFLVIKANSQTIKNEKIVVN